MQLREIASISGKPGLYRILKPTHSGVIIEALDATRARTVAGSTSKVSVLSEVSMYTTDAEGSVPLGDILLSIREKFKAEPLPVSHKSDGADLHEFMTQVLPNWDQGRVYTSDIKKLVSWYTLLAQNAPELLEKQVEATPEPAAAESKSETKVEEEPKPKAKKAPKGVADAAISEVPVAIEVSEEETPKGKVKTGKAAQKLSADPNPKK